MQSNADGVQSCCSQCEEGKISFAGSQTSCLLCPPGTRSNEDYTECLKCVSGTASLGGSASCDNCSPASGEFSTGEGNVVCSRILPGHYFSDNAGQQLPCPAGKFSADGASNADGCTACREGSFSLASAAYCTMVSAGKSVTFSEDVRVGEEDCSEGMFSAGAKDSCSSCGDGWAPVGAASCVAPGKYWDGDNTVERSCPAGTKSTHGADNLAGCEACRGDGKYSVEAGATACRVVGAGKGVVKNEDGNGIGFTKCLANHYSTGASDNCKACAIGHSEAGQAACVSTPQGHYWNGTFDVQCPAGRFSASGAYGALSLGGCEVCGDGTYSEIGSNYCSTVSAGKKVVKDGELRVNVTECDENTHSTGGKDDCLNCATGSYSLSGAFACISCSGGEYYDSINKTCEKCPASTYTLSGASDIDGCELCNGEGEYSFDWSFLLLDSRIRNEAQQRSYRDSWMQRQ